MPKRHTLGLSTISIHALHEESDPRNPQPRNRLRISIHALHEESDQLADA